MGNAAYGAAERSELSQIDFFLDHLARAVDHGDVPYHSYEVLAPRYLSRRQELVEILTSPPAGSPDQSVRRSRPGTLPPQGAAAAWSPEPRSSRARRDVVGDWDAGWETAPAREVQAAARPRSEPVAWSTVLLFLGAFLVIVASAIFAMAVWNTTGVVFKLAFLGTLTAAFYASGFVARTKFELGAGSAALTVVGSAMLLFDCWIVISGMRLAGPMPWAVALFICSAVYWFTELRLGDGFYGIAGAAAQVGWWWLMATGLHLQTPVRLAGLAAIALLWHVVAQRAETSPTFRSLSAMLLWTAPLLSVACAIGMAVDALVMGAPSWTLVGSAAVVSAGGAVVWMRTTLAREPATRWVAGLVQVAIFVAVTLPGTPTWLSVAMLAAIAAVYALVSLTFGGAPFAAASAAMELIAILALLRVVHAADDVTLGAVALVAVTWMLASRLVEPESRRSAFARATYAEEFAVLMQVASLGVLGAASVSVPLVAGGVPLTGVLVGGRDIALSAGVLFAWALTSVLRRNAATALPMSLWSFYALAGALAWVAPSAHSAFYAIALLALAAVWLFARRPVGRFYDLDEQFVGWLMRALAILFFAGGLLAEMYYFHTIESWPAALLAAAIAAVFLADAEFSGPEPSAAIAGAVAVGAAYLAGAHVSRTASGGSICGALAGLALGGSGALIRTVRARYSAWLAVAAAIGTTLVCFSGVDGWWLAGTLAIASLTWGAVVFAAEDEWFSLPAGALVFAASAAACAAVNGGPILTVVVTGSVGLGLGMPAFLESTGPEGAHSRSGAALAIAGFGGLAAVAGLGLMLGAVGAPDGSLGDAAWIVSRGLPEVLALLVFGAYTVTQASRWNIEVGTYLGWGAMLIALLVEFDSVGITTIELYTTSLALYLVAMGELYARQAEGRRVPAGIDVAAVIVALGVPALGALGDGGAAGLTHFAWVLGLSTVAIFVGVLMRVRGYFLGGVGATVLVVGIKSLGYLTQYWWVLLGVLGIGMLLTALTWERQRAMVSDTRLQLADMLSNWR